MANRHGGATASAHFGATVATLIEVSDTSTFVTEVPAFVVEVSEVSDSSTFVTEVFTFAIEAPDSSTFVAEVSTFVIEVFYRANNYAFANCIIVDMVELTRGSGH